MDLSPLAAVAESLGVTALYFHGSRARGEAREDSDLDLAVLGGRFVEVAGELAQAASALTGLPFEAVDVQDLRAAPAWFAAQVVCGGTLLYVGDSTRLAEFQARALSEHFDEEIRLRPVYEAMWEAIRASR